MKHYLLINLLLRGRRQKRIYHQCDQIWQNTPLGQTVKYFWLFSEGLFCIWQNFDPNWANFYEIEQIFIVANGPILKR